MNAAQVLILLEQTKIAPVFFNPDIEYSKKIVKACYDGGMRVFEFTNRGIEAPTVFSALRDFVNENLCFALGYKHGVFKVNAGHDESFWLIALRSI